MITVCIVSCHRITVTMRKAKPRQKQGRKYRWSISQNHHKETAEIPQPSVGGSTKRAQKRHRKIAQPGVKNTVYVVFSNRK